MKKTFIVAAALVCAACTSPAEKAVKNYLESNSNDGKIEIVEMSEVEDFTYDFDPAWILKSEFSAAVSDVEYCEKLYQITHAPEDLEEWRSAIAKADSLQSIIDTIKTEHYPMKRTTVKFRGKNAVSAMVLDTATLYLSNDLSKVSVKPNEVL